MKIDVRQIKKFGQQFRYAICEVAYTLLILIFLAGNEVGDGFCMQ